jgi:hypothetical protein
MENTEEITTITETLAEKTEVISSQLGEINTSILFSSTEVLQNILAQWPKILIALGLIIVGALFGKLLQWSIVKIAHKIKIHTLSEKIGFTELIKRAQIQSSPSEVIGKFLGGYVFTLFFLASSKIVGLDAISEFLNSVIFYIPHIVVALFIVLFGIQISDTVYAIVYSTLKILKTGGAKVLSEFARYVIILFAILAALLQLNIAENLVTILFIGVISSLSLATGLALGLGTKDFIAKILQDLKNHNDNHE